MDTIKINIETNAEQASKSFEDLAKSFNDTDKQAVDLRKEIKEMKKELYTLTPGTEEYSKKIQELGAKMNQLGDTQRQLRAATGGLDTVFQSSTIALSNLASGFQAAMGVTALFGKNAEDLQKTFVKLQAIMSITNGLKGLAAFPKHMKDAVYSIKAYTASLKLATNSTNVFTAAFNKLRMAISKSGVGLAVVALAALATIIMDVNKREEKRLDALDKLNKATDEAKEETSEYIQTLREYEQTLEESGVIESERNQTLIEKTEERIEAKKEEIKAVEEEMRVQKLLQSQTSDYVSSLGGEFEEYQNLVDIENKNNAEMIESEANIKKNKAAVEQLSNELQNLYVKLGQSKISEALSGLSDEFKVKMAGGLADQGDYIRAQMKVYQDAKNELWETVGAGHHAHSQIKGATEEERKANKDLSTSFAATLAGLQVELDAYNAGIEKKNRDAAQRLADQLKNNYKNLIKDVTDEANKIKEEWNSVLNSLDFETLSLLPPEDRSGRISAQAFRFETEIETYIDTWRKLAQDAVNKKEITEDQFNDFIESIDGIKDNLKESLNADIDINISDDIRNLGKSIQESIGKIKLDNESMLKALSAGLISKQEYQEWLVKTMQEYNGIANQVIETNNPTEAAFIAASKAIIPPEVKTQMENEIKAYYDEIVKQLDKEYERLEKRYTTSRELFDSWVNDKNRSWLEGGTNTSYWGDSASTTYQKMQEQTEELYKLLHSEYEEEIQLLEERMKLLDKNSEAFFNYKEKLEELRQADLNAQHDYETASLANTRQYNQDVLQLHVELADSLSGLAGAIGSYYTEQKEWARETYGENSKEYEKYLQREGYMKKAQVWIDWATGVMTAWSTSEQLGPIAGPIMAALQTAALTTTALTSVKTINRQAKISGDDGATANVGQLTDRVIMADAQRTDQTAQLNAQYNQGATRVYVTQGDIQDANNENRVAVTQNKF